MTKNEMERLLDTVYELEGLLQLALSREELPARIPELITAKVAKISGQAGLTAAPVAGGDRTARYDMTDEEVAEAAESEESDDADMTDEDIAEAAESEESGDADMTEEEVAEAAESEESGDADMTDEDIAEAAEPEVVREAGPGVTVQVTAAARPGLRSRFSLNDRFRFSRALFNGNTARFDETVRILEGCVSYEDAEDYLIDDLGWDPEADDDAAEFVDILRNYFDL